MNYKGDYAGGTSYNIGDVVVYTDGVAYQKIKAAAAGITPHEVRIWQRVPQPMQDVIKMFYGMLKSISSALIELEDDLTQETAGKKALDAHQGYVLKDLIDTASASIPGNINDEAITLKDSSDNEYLITVDASGDTPELVVTAITPEVEEGAET